MQSELNSGCVFDDSIMLHWSYGAKSPGHGVASKHRKDFYGSEVTLQRNSNNAILSWTRPPLMERTQKKEAFTLEN